MLKVAPLFGGGGGLQYFGTLTVFSCRFLPILPASVRHFYRFLRFTTKQFPQTTLFAQKERARKKDFFFSVHSEDFSRFFFCILCMALKKFTKCFVKETKTLQRSRGCRCWQWSANCSAKCPPATYLPLFLSVSLHLLLALFLVLQLVLICHTNFCELFYAAAAARKSLAVVTATPTQFRPLFRAVNIHLFHSVYFPLLHWVWQTFRCHALSFVSPLVCRLLYF